MARLVGRAAMSPAMGRGSGLAGISSSERLATGDSARLLSLMRRSSDACTGRASVSTLGPVWRSWRACAAAGGSGQTPEPSESQNQQARRTESSARASSSSYLADPPGFLNVQESNFFKGPQSNNKGWDDYRLLAELRCLAVTADDRAEMHSAVAIQRDNWGKLIQVTITMSMISAGILSALNSAAGSFSLSLTATLLSAGSILFMCLENWFQPSQLAEEQRAAARFFRNLVKEIEVNLKLGGSQLKEEATLFYQAKVERLSYLDRAFPLPLFPGGIAKFPKKVGPSILSAPVDMSKPELSPTSQNSDNGWSSAITEDLKRTSSLLKRADISNYVGWEKNVLKLNKVLAIAGPLLAFSSIVANLVGGGGAAAGPVVAAGCCVLAALCSSFSHDAQVGMVYEMYRDVAGTFEDIDKEIQRNLRLPVDQREDGEIFHQKIALQLGRMESKDIVSSDDQKTAGTLL